jgi:isoquinoline 1-oxidoreductase beta subunit
MNALTRREFLLVSATAAGGILFRWSSAPAATPEHRGAALDDFIRIDPDNRVTIGARATEIGQGVRTALPMLIAEELDVRWEDVVVEPLPLLLLVTPQGLKLKVGDQGVGGSTSIPDAWDDHRKAGALARARLVAAAAQLWKTEPVTLRTAAGHVLHPDGRRVAYGALAPIAAKLPAPDGDVRFKDPRDWTIIGRPQRVVDARDIVTGRAEYGLDVREPGMLVAVVARCPYFSGGLAGYDDKDARAVPGVVDVVTLPGPKPEDPITLNLAAGVAVVARDTWTAIKAREKLRIEWTRGPFAEESSESFDARCRALLDGEGKVVRDDGDVPAASKRAAKIVRAEYRVPFAAHATMEPQSAFARLDGNRATVVLPTQSPEAIPRLALNVAGIPRENVFVRMTRAGGGFGRRLTVDYAAEALHVAKLTGKPVQVVWTREDDMAHDWYRPGGRHQLIAALDDGGRVTAWTHRLASAHKYYRRPDLKPGDEWTPELYPDDFPAGMVPNLRLEWLDAASGIQRGSWRAPAHTANAYAVQSFVDEIAHASGQDALALRLALLGEPRELDYHQHGGPKFDTGRLAAVLRLVAKEIDWGRALPKGDGLGLAAHFTFGGYAAHAMHVTVGPDGALSIRRVVCAIDVGVPVNPLGIRAQMEGGTIDGLSTALNLEITVREARIVQRNFNDYPLLGLKGAPRDVEVHIVPSSASPSGCGEMGIPTVAPALCNAIFNACGKRIRVLPIRDQLREGLAS